ncbi:MAG: tRNA 2-thiouridine(34) synthase MnmA [Clostridia bacterium]
MHQKVLVAMSGGVDSSVAAAILKKNQYDVTGVTLKLFEGPDDADEAGHPVDARAGKTCCSLEDVEDARCCANALGIPYHVLNFKEFFFDAVIQPFVDSYVRGETPNPCIECNRAIKFEKLLERAVALGMDFIATGHYAKVELDAATGRYLLKKPLDASKDQTYALYNLTQYQLSRTLFPLGELKKTEVRALALETGLLNAAKADSQEICFVTDNDYARFISTFKPLVPGDFLNLQGEKIGRHKGIEAYTIGQRKGLGLSGGRPLFVVAIDAVHNTVTVGDQADLFSASLIAKDLNFISIEALEAPMRVQAKIRYRAEAADAVISPLDDGRVRVEFDVAQRAATPGQAVVFYDGDLVVGGGKIEKTIICKK